MSKVVTVIGGVASILCISFFCLVFYTASRVESPTRVIPSPTPIVIPTPTIPPVDNDLKQEIESAYMEGCNFDGKQAEYCQCTFDYLYSKFGVNTDRYSAYINEAASECLYLYKF